MFMLRSQTPCMNRTSPTKSNPLYKLWHHDQSLQRCRGVSESKWHDQVLKISEVSVKVHFPFPFLILTRCYEFCKSSLSYYKDPWCSPKAEDNSSRGYLFLTVILFSLWKSIQRSRGLSSLYGSQHGVGSGRTNYPNGQGVCNATFHNLPLWLREAVQTSG